MLMQQGAEALSGQREKDVELVEKVLTPMVSVLHAAFLEPLPPVRDVLFFPSDASKARLLRLLASARRSCDVCVFTITDDEVCQALLALHTAEVQVRLITDDEMATSRDSLIFRLAEAGVPTVVAEELLRARAPHRHSLHPVAGRHMHHKFAIVDASILLTGSYNYTKAAGSINTENVMVTSAPSAVCAYAAEFDRLWASFTAKMQLSSHAAAVRIQSLLRGRQGRRSIRPASPPGTLESKQAVRRKSMASSALAERVCLEVSWGEEVDSMLDGLQPGAPTIGMEEAKAALRRFGATSAQAAVLRETTLRHVADRFTVARQQCVALLRAGSVIVGACESCLFQTPNRRDFLFFPSEVSLSRLLGHLAKARRSLDVAIYDLSDDRIRDALLERHRQGVKVRVISDSENAMREGSDIMDLASAGVATVVGCELSTASAAHRPIMHNKFVIIDELTLITGSYNFTYSASDKNFENLLATDDNFFVSRYSDEFERLWAIFWGHTFGDRRYNARPGRAIVRLQSIQRGKQVRKSISLRRATLQLADPSAFPALR